MNPLTMWAYLRIMRSNQPQRLFLPVVTPHSWPRFCSRSPISCMRIEQVRGSHAWLSRLVEPSVPHPPAPWLRAIWKLHPLTNALHTGRGPQLRPHHLADCPLLKAGGLCLASGHRQPLPPSPQLPPAGRRGQNRPVLQPSWGPAGVSLFPLGPHPCPCAPCYPSHSGLQAHLLRTKAYCPRSHQDTRPG